MEKHSWFWWLSGKAKALADAKATVARKQTDQRSTAQEQVQRTDAATQRDAGDGSH